MVTKAEGWDCGRHLHSTEAEANRCVEQWEKVRQRQRERARVRDAGWLVMSQGDFIIAVNKNTNAGCWEVIPEGIPISQMNAREHEFLRTLQ